jgi:hypothetical protein
MRGFMSHEDALYTLLKGAEELETAEGVPGKALIRPDPKDRAERGVHAPWGEDGPEAGGLLTPNQHSDATDLENEDGRRGMIARNFSHSHEADAAAQRILAKNLAHFASGDFTTSSPQLSSRMRVKKAQVEAPTLAEQVIKATGRF